MRHSETNANPTYMTFIMLSGPIILYLAADGDSQLIPTRFKQQMEDPLASPKAF